MLQENVGNIAGLLWNTLQAAEGPLTFKQIKKITKLTEKNFLLGLGWLLREDKISATETGDEKDPYAYGLK